MLLVNRSKRFEAVRNYFLESSSKRFETVSNYSLPQHSITRLVSGFERFRTIWNYLGKIWDSSYASVMISFERFETVRNYLLENSFERFEAVSNQSLGDTYLHSLSHPIFTMDLQILMCIYIYSLYNHMYVCLCIYIYCVCAFVFWQILGI